MKQLLISALILCNVFYCSLYAIEIGLGNGLPPYPRVGEESMSMMSGTSSTTLKKSSSLKTTSSTAYYPVSAYVDEVALTVTFTQSVGTATVMVYDANGQLVDMTTFDTNSTYEAVLSTEAWSSGNYTLVISYGTTTLTGAFTF